MLVAVEGLGEAEAEVCLPIAVDVMGGDGAHAVLTVV